VHGSYGAGLKAGGAERGFSMAAFTTFLSSWAMMGLLRMYDSLRKLQGVDLHEKFVVASSASTTSVRASFFPVAEKKGHFLCLSLVQYSLSSKMLGI
jgi:hypothetical protein